MAATMAPHDAVLLSPSRSRVTRQVGRSGRKFFPMCPRLVSEAPHSCSEKQHLPSTAVGCDGMRHWAWCMYMHSDHPLIRELRLDDAGAQIGPEWRRLIEANGFNISLTLEFLRAAAAGAGVSDRVRVLTA